MRTSFKFKALCLSMAMAILNTAVFPTMALALTGGPSQPEVEAFEPVSTTQMVDPFSGDFTYNIPLLNVPGPNGGYPINIAYHAGITMEQEASWVGLGWTLNVGAITRSLRGLPDDFNGDEIVKQNYHKPNWTLGIKGIYGREAGSTWEIIGADFNLKNEKQNSFRLRGELRYNNYKGIGFAIGGGGGSGHGSSSRIGFSNSQKNNAFNFDFDIDNQNGIGLSGSTNFQAKLAKVLRNFNLGFGLHSKSGLELSGGIGKKQIKVNNNGLTVNYGKWGGRIPFNYGIYRPSISYAMAGFNAGFSLEKMEKKSAVTTYVPSVLTNETYKTKSTQFELFYSEQKIKEKESILRGYGYTYSQNQSNNQDALMDIVREKNNPINRATPHLYVPTQSYDLFQYTGQGIGGLIKPMRSDLGIYCDPTIKNKFNDVHAGKEKAIYTGSSVGDHLGIDLKYSYSEAYSGKWKNPASWSDIQQKVNFSSGNQHFKVVNEQTANSSDETQRFGGENPIVFDLKNRWNGIGFEPFVFNRNPHSNKEQISYNNRINRETQNTHVQYRTYEQMKNGPYPKPENVFNLNTYPYLNTTQQNGQAKINYDVSKTSQLSHIAQMIVVNPDGSKYVYGLPALNHSHKDVHFSVDSEGPNSDKKTVSYSPSDASISNSKGLENFFQSTEFPRYVHTHMLTEIYSPDYVDLTGDGPSADDFGYYVKINYSKAHSNFNWRIPFVGANYLPEQNSNLLDDKAGYSYGSKEIWYVNSIETKTHIAIFQVSDRHDGYAPSDESNSNISSPGFATTKLQKLDCITLYSKNDLNTPIKKVHFDYDYSLCKNVANHNPSSPSNQKGKLTLVKIWFTHLNNLKGSLSPYEFIYSTQSGDNPDYKEDQIDRWGYYKPDNNTSSSIKNNNLDNPYVDQYDKANQDKYMSVWNLKKIKLPSGGEIEVVYESDDYGYVQDKPAMMMYQILHTGRTSQPMEGGNLTKESGELTDRIYFKLKNDPPCAANCSTAALNQVIAAVENINDLYFKVNLRLKKKPESSDQAYDYVTGYCEINREGEWRGVYNNNGTYEGWVKVKFVPVRKTTGNAESVHPFRKAAWEYMKLERPDLFYPNLPSNKPLLQLATSVVNLLQEFEKLFLGFYYTALINGWADRIEQNDQSANYKPSFIRLNAVHDPDQDGAMENIKYGGGHRVKEIKMVDNWATISGESENNSTYTQEFSYTLPDGSSSGVAEYEPSVGGDEIPHRVPSKRFNSKGKIHSNIQDLYLEEPFGESYFPSPNVGYSRVIIKSKQPSGADNSLSQNGLLVHEFYTARDFPVLINQTPIVKKHFPITLMIPFIGAIEFDNNGYSQGYSIELNDMHGKTKSLAQYDYMANLNAPSVQAQSKTVYLFKTKQDQLPFGIPVPARLDNSVMVLDNDAIFRYATLGQEIEFFADKYENSDFEITGGLAMNFELTSSTTLLTSLYPSFKYNEGMTRAIVTNKIIYKTGILEKIEQHQDGSKATTTNLMFDSQTGQPLLTSVTNDFEAPVYSYSFAGHWAYEDLSGAYKNYREFLPGVTISQAGIYPVNSPNSTSNFRKGDEVEVSIVASPTNLLKRFWVKNVNGNSLELVDEDGVNIPTGTASYLCVMNPIRKNQQSITNGKIVSLSHPIYARQNPVFSALNLRLQTQSNYDSNIEYTDCSTGQTFNFVVQISQAGKQLKLTRTGIQECEATINVPPGSSIVFTPTNIYDYQFAKKGNKIEVTLAAPSQITYLLDWNDSYNCFPECLDNVLHADAQIFNGAAWNYNYLDFGDPEIKYNNSPLKLSQLSQQTTFNEYRYGMVGIWRNESSWAYQVNRKQTTPKTKTDIDGTYENFVLFNWQAGENYNPFWTKTSKITKYSPYGFPVEDQDALGIPSTGLYGYSNSLMTAICGNANYFELAFDGFEDYGSTGYPTSGLGHGHLTLKVSQPSTYPSLSSAYSHTGKYSIPISPSVSYFNIPVVAVSSSNPDRPQQIMNTFSFVEGKKYTVSAWFRYTGGTPEILVNGNPASAIVTASSIDGWKQLEATITAPSVANGPVTLTFTIGSGTAYIDDVRIHPFNSSPKTYVYNPSTLWLIAELDERNFATFYNYDEEGKLVQIKKETANGITTLKTTRDNIRK
jgi:hypothetical protein